MARRALEAPRPTKIPSVRLTKARRSRLASFNQRLMTASLDGIPAMSPVLTRLSAEGVIAMPKSALVTILYFGLSVGSHADGISESARAFDNARKIDGNGHAIILADDSKQPTEYTIVGKPAVQNNNLKLVISKCRQDECTRTWIKSETKIGDSLYYVTTVSSEIIDYKTNWENGATPTQDEDRWHLSCAPNHPFNNDAIIENDGGSSNAHTEDATAIWNAVCHKTFGVLQ